jgi:hypothetical protein
MSLALVMAALAAFGCEKKKATFKSEEGEHAHGKGPNGGVVFDLGKYHAEFTVDHDKKTATVLMLGIDEKTVVTVSATELALVTKETKTKDGKAVPAMTIKLVAQDPISGKASKFVGTDPGLGNVADFEGTVSGEIDGKPAKGAFKE